MNILKEKQFLKNKMSDSGLIEEINPKILVVEENDGENNNIFRNKCPQCLQTRTESNFCVKYQRDYYINRYNKWTSKDPKINDLIRYTQANSNYYGSLEYIEWSDLDIIEYVDRGFFGEIYSAYWLLGPLIMWDCDLEFYNRHGPIRVAIKKMDKSREFSQDFINKVIIIKLSFFFLIIFVFLNSSFIHSFLSFLRSCTIFIDV